MKVRSDAQRVLEAKVKIEAEEVGDKEGQEAQGRQLKWKSPDKCEEMEVDLVITKAAFVSMHN